MSDTIRILYVDDYPHDRALVRDALEEAGGFQVTEAVSREAFEEQLKEREYDLVLSDFNILGFTGLDVIDAVRDEDPELPVVIVTGTGSEEIAVKAMRRGAADYVIKSPAHIRRLPHTIHAVLETQRLKQEREAAQRSLREAYEESLRRQEAMLSLTEDLREEIEERKSVQEALRKSEARFRGAFANAGAGMALVDPEGRFVSVNEAVCRMLGYTREELLTMTYEEITHDDDVGRSSEAYAKLLTGEYDSYELEKRYRHKEGYTLWGRLNISLVRDQEGDPLYAVAQLHDITERKRARVEMRHLVHDLEFLSRSATELISMETEEEIYQYLGESLDALLEDAVVIINTNDPASQTMGIAGVYGLGSSLSERAFEVLGSSPVGQTYPMHAEAQRFFETGELAVFPRGLARLGEGYIPPAVLEQLQELLDIGRVYLIGLARGGDLYAGVQVYTRDGATIERPDLIETFIRQASIALERRRAERQLEASRNRFREVFEQAPLGIYRTTPEGEILMANPALLEMLGYDSFEELAERDLESEGYHSNYPRSEFKRLMEKEGRALGLESAWTKKDGSILFIRENVRAVRDAEGKIIYYEGSVEDITERKQAEQELHRAAEERRVLLELLPVGITITDEEGQIIDANHMSQELLELSAAEHRERRFNGEEWDIIRPDGTPMPAKEYASVRALEDQRTVRNVEMGIVKADDEVTWISVSAAPIPLEGYGVAIAYADITERKRAEEALKQRQRELAALLDIGRQLAVQLDLEALLDAVADVVVDMLPAAEASSLWLHDEEQGALIASAWSAHDEEAISGLAVSPTTSLVGLVCQAASARVIDDAPASPVFEPFGRPVLDAVKSVLGVPVIVDGEVIGALFADNFSQTHAFDDHDVELLESLAAQASVAIQNAYLYEAELEARERLRDLAGHLREAREEERTRIAQEVHDEFGQMMTALKMDLSWLRKRLPSDQPQVMERAEAMSGIIDRSFQVVRRIASELRPGILDDLGLTAAIEWQAEAFAERSGIALRLDLDEAADMLDRQISTALFRILQEALTNVARHARAEEVHITLRVEPEEVTLVVADDGRGVTEEEMSRSESLGLIGMRERARALGGTVTVEGAPGRGTTVTASVRHHGSRITNATNGRITNGTNGANDTNGRMDE